MTETHKRIGDLNGPWAKLFKFSQLAIPIVAMTVLPASVWLVGKVHAQDMAIQGIQQWMAQGPRFTAVDAERLRLQVMSEMKDGLSPKLDDILTRLARIEVQLDIQSKKGKQQ